MKIYNTLSRTLEEFKPIEPGKVSMYVCGPTVYNLIHIGNARPMIVFDTFRRYMAYRGYEVDYVSNFTDVDDKIINKAKEEGVESTVISERYIAECKKDMEGLNVLPATVHPKATEEIGGMVELIQKLIDKGYAYAAKDGTVYYRTRAFKEYGKLSHKNLDELEGGHRQINVSGEEGKEDPLDFVLWKPKKEGEPFWESPWCEGRPGWHTECSVMARKYLGNTIDIHAGGEDLIFPHHENEIAQSEAANGVPFAHYWMHNGFLNIDNQKMSKSLGNFFTVRDIAEKYDLQVLRFFMLSAHYRSPLNFSAALMESAKAGLSRIRNSVSDLAYREANADRKELWPKEEEILSELGRLKEKFNEVMDQDLNTADGISVIFEIVRLANTAVKEECSSECARTLKEALNELCGVMGLVTEKEEEGSLDEEIEKLIDQRQEARKNKDFAKADEIRDLLLKKGIILKDTREGVKWERA
ncbi:MAG: cysteine--tRNA ligase [Lachnospiraceae bacterium]|nr:cysteine--tRNA ligase [Lachnospiraceae bacterium]